MQCSAAAPYFPLSDTLMKPLRPREVISELLASGLPVCPTAHLGLNKAHDSKLFLRSSKRLVALARDRGPLLAAHVAVAVQRGLLRSECQPYFTEARKAILSVNKAVASSALSAVVCLSFPVLAYMIEFLSPECSVFSSRHHGSTCFPLKSVPFKTEQSSPKEITFSRRKRFP
jgi:hypothetical protein